MSDRIAKPSPATRHVSPDDKGRRRSERVVLRVPLSLSTTIRDGKRIRLEAWTQVVNAHGGLLDVGVEMLPGQKMILGNPKTERIEVCRVVRVEKSDETRFSVAFEFDIPAPQFWPVSFPPEDWHLNAARPNTQDS